MKRIFLLLLMALAGCTSDNFQFGNAHFQRTSFLQHTDIASVKIGTNGVIELVGYHNLGDSAMAAAITEAAVKGAVQGAK